MEQNKLDTKINIFLDIDTKFLISGLSDIEELNFGLLLKLV